MDRGARGLAILLLGGVALSHMADLPHKLTETPYMAYLFVGLISAALLLALAIAADVRGSLDAAAAISLLTLAGYVVSRSSGLPGLADHVGDWVSTAGVVAFASETGLVALALRARLSARAARPAVVVARFSIPAQQPVR